MTKLTNAIDTEARRLADELELCRRYYEATFPAQPITKLIFTGGGAKDRLLCAAVAQAMALPAQIGDPLVRFARADYLRSRASIAVKPNPNGRSPSACRCVPSRQVCDEY